MLGVDRPLLDSPAPARERVVRELADALHRQIDVVFAYLHGSFTTDRPFHDIDVAVFLDAPTVGVTDRVLDLGDRLSLVSGYPVDVRAINDAPLAFQFRALQGRLLAVQDEEQLANFMERVGRRYLDIAPVLRSATRDAFMR
jgi:predicted nucleotidyltransferase